MASGLVGLLVRRTSFYAFGFFNLCLFLGLFIKNGTFFKKDTEKDKLQFAIGQEALWDPKECILTSF